MIKSQDNYLGISKYKLSLEMLFQLNSRSSLLKSLGFIVVMTIYFLDNECEDFFPADLFSGTFYPGIISRGIFFGDPFSGIQRNLYRL